MTETLSARRYSVAQIALGLLIVWQLIFLPASNLLGLIPHGATDDGELTDSRYNPGPDTGSSLVQKAIDLAGNTVDRWGFATGQVQAWWLFAPDEIGRASCRERV